jgi:predicted ribosomally synthesized peptide with nif11-like leader
MSVDTAKQLIAKIHADPELRRTFQQAGEKAFAATARVAGHDVSAADMHAALQQVNVGHLTNLRPQMPGGNSAIVSLIAITLI